MADAGNPGANMPPPPPNAGAPGYDGMNQGAPQQQQMPPPLAPIITQNTNPIPTAMGSPLPGGPMSAMSPSSGGPGYVPRRAAPEPNKRALYVGGLDPRVTEDVLRQIFETTGHVQSVKIIPDKTVSSPSVRHFSGRIMPTCANFPRASTTDSSSTMTPARLSGAWPRSMAVASTTT
jgi:nucleolysin TIA-1/TIAR